MTNDKPVARRDMSKLHPLPERHAEIPLVRLYTEAQIKKIQRGLIPQVMEDKWAIFYEGGTLYLHRSWTGYCIYEADFFHEPPDGWYLRGLRVNQDPTQYSGMSDEVAVFETLLSMLVKGR